MFQAICTNDSYSDVRSRLFSRTLINKLINLLTSNDYMEQNPSKQANNVP